MHTLQAISLLLKLCSKIRKIWFPLVFSIYPSLGYSLFCLTGNCLLLPNRMLWLFSQSDWETIFSWVLLKSTLLGQNNWYCWGHLPGHIFLSYFHGTLPFPGSWSHSLNHFLLFLFLGLTFDVILISKINHLFPK